MTTQLATIPDDEAERLEVCEATIEKGLRNFVAVGTALIEIQKYRLYRATHSNFGHYCRERWDMGKSRAHQMIEAAQIVGILPISPEPTVISPLKVSTMVDSQPQTVPAPESERSIRPLSKLPESEIPAAYVRAVEIAGGKSPTAGQTQQAVDERQSGNIGETKTKPTRPSDGIRIATKAVKLLETISSDDMQADEAIGIIERWMEENDL